LANVKKIFSSETAGPNGAKLGRKHLCKILYKTSSFNSISSGGCHGRDRMVVGFTATYAISAYHQQRYALEFHSWRGVLEITLCDRGVLETKLCHQVCQRLAADLWFSPGAPSSSTNRPDRHDITEILLKVALSTIKQTNKHNEIKLGTLTSIGRCNEIKLGTLTSSCRCDEIKLKTLT
jgi:hypothetical protein